MFMFFSLFSLNPFSLYFSDYSGSKGLSNGVGVCCKDKEYIKHFLGSDPCVKHSMNVPAIICAFVF